MTPARILHLRASNFVGGPENQLLRHARNERGRAWEVWIAVYVNGNEGKPFLLAAQELGIPSVALPVESVFSSVKTLCRTLRENEIKLICTHGYKAEVIGALAGMLTRTPVACFLRGWTGENMKVKFYEAVERLTLRFASRIVCLSNLQARKIALRRSLAWKIRVVRNAIDHVPVSRQQSRRLLAQRLSLPDQSTIIATAGRLSPEKGVSDFLEAASLVNGDHESLYFVIFGEGALGKFLREKSHSLKIDDKVVFAGFQRDLRDLLPGIDMLVNASQSEEMPNVVLEAMAAGVPVVATEVGGVAEIAGEDPAIRLVPPREPQLLASEISCLLRSPDLGRSLGEKGLDRVKRAFSVESQAREYNSLYQELVSLQKCTNGAGREERGTV